MNRQWILQLACDIETKYSAKIKGKMFSGVDSIQNNSESLSAWFDLFTSGLDELNDKEFLRQMMAERCPCGGDYKKDGEAMKEIYNKSYTLTKFVCNLKKWMFDKYGDTDEMELEGNVLYMTKPLGGGEDTGSCGMGCHCWLAKHTDKVVSDIFCHCCTIGHTGRPFQVAFGNDIKMEFIESIICGGKNCIMAVYLPEKPKQ